jgi:hypothetical protein
MHMSASESVFVLSPIAMASLSVVAQTIVGSTLAIS